MIYLFILLALLTIVGLVVWSAVDDLRQADEYKCSFDGPAMVSTGVDNRDGNTVGDDR